MRGWKVNMEIFKWMKEIEEVYIELIEKAKKENLDDIEKLKNDQDNHVEKILLTKQELINSALKSLSEELEQKENDFKKKISQILKKNEINYEENKIQLISSVIKQLELEFDARS